ncbi:MAG: ATPase domain-containing protein [Candidatus Geothermarchaeales archaeon]
MSSDYVPTGIPGVDELLGGKGLLRGYVTFITGGPGTGKTTFAIQFLNNGVIRYNESGVYVSFDEKPSSFAHSPSKER